MYKLRPADGKNGFLDMGSSVDIFVNAKFVALDIGFHGFPFESKHK